MAITAVTVNAASIPLADVVYDIAITHGRADITNPGQASTCVFTVLLDPADPMPAAIGQVVTVSAFSTPRFTGTVTAVDLAHAGDATSCTITAIGYLDRLDRLVTGTSGFVEETFGTRAAAILTATGLTYSLSSDDGTVLVAEDPDTVTVRQYLQTLCLAVGATMCDLPDGNILLETYTRRSTNYASGAWNTATGTWAGNTQAWNTTRIPLELPPAAVEWEPRWYLRQDTIVNKVTISYGTGTPKPTTTVSDTTSISTYGERAAYIDTSIKNLADASARGSGILTAQATPHWNIDQVTVNIDQLDATTRTAALNLEAGDRVILSNLPQAAPDTVYFGVVEGWTETHTPEAHRLTLNLSDPRFSYAMAAWSDVSGALTWAGVNTSRAWTDIVFVSDLT